MTATDQGPFIALQRALLGRFSLERELGRGGMGTVYLARDLALDRIVAIKALHPELAARADARERFLREARVAARLMHPNIVPVYAVEAIEGYTVIVMAYVDGESLGARLRRRGPLAPDQAERMLREIGWALSYAHASGVLHRDITLENILMERGTDRALLADFGLARETRSAESGPLLGTPAYLAPEVIRGDPSTARSDLYALGIVGWAALVGEPPFTGETAGAVLARQLVQPVPPLAPRASGASRRLVGAIERCLAKDPDDRPVDPAAFLASLEREAPTIALAPALRSWFGRWERIRPTYALLAPILAVQTYLMFAVYFARGYGALLITAVIEMAFTLTVVPAAIQLAFEYQELRRLRRAGFTVDDVRSAAPHWREELVREYRREGLRPIASRVVFDLTVFGAALLLFNFLLLNPTFGLLKDLAPRVQEYLLGLYYLSPEVYMFTLLGAGMLLASPGYRIPPRGRIRRWIERFWHTRLAAQLWRMAVVREPAHLDASATLHRPTEMVLGLAVDDLWSEIPADFRQELGDVPTLAHTLNASATDLRGLIEQLRESEESVHDAPEEVARLTGLRARLEQEHRLTVATLERIRLGLLRMLASRARSSELTQQLETARRLETDLLRDVAGHAAVRRALRQRSAPRGRTPTPTPSAA